MNNKRVNGKGCGNKLLGQQATNSPYSSSIYPSVHAETWPQLMLLHLANHMTTTCTTVHGPPQWSQFQGHTNGLNTPPLYWYKFVGVFSQSNSLSCDMTCHKQLEQVFITHYSVRLSKGRHLSAITAFQVYQFPFSQGSSKVSKLEN